MVAVLN